MAPRRGAGNPATTTALSSHSLRRLPDPGAVLFAFFIQQLQITLTLLLPREDSSLRVRVPCKAKAATNGRQDCAVDTLGSFTPLSLGLSLSPGKCRQPAGGSGTGRDQHRGAPLHHVPPQGSASPEPTRVSLRSSAQRKGAWKQCGVKGLRSFQQQSPSSQPIPASREPNPAGHGEHAATLPA